MINAKNCRNFLTYFSSLRILLYIPYMPSVYIPEIPQQGEFKLDIPSIARNFRDEFLRKTGQEVEKTFDVEGMILDILSQGLEVTGLNHTGQMSYVNMSISISSKTPDNQKARWRELSNAFQTNNRFISRQK